MPRYFAAKHTVVPFGQNVMASEPFRCTRAREENLDPSSAPSTSRVGA
jgi:hypothetical protein